MANEKLLIDANALPISKEYCVDEAGFGATFYVVHKDAIDNAPTVEVEVVHGRWAIINDYCCVCSVCHNASTQTYYYCPECGAKMDGDENEID